jgi:hypothetical protein
MDLKQSEYTAGGSEKGDQRQTNAPSNDQNAPWRRQGSAVEWTELDKPVLIVYYISITNVIQKVHICKNQRRGHRQESPDKAAAIKKEDNP